ncbi:MAG: hypothetical protein ACRDA5_02305 [Clostridium sp.]
MQLQDKQAEMKANGVKFIECIKCKEAFFKNSVSFKNNICNTCYKSRAMK